MILWSSFICVWATAVAAQSTTDAHFIGWYIQPDLSELWKYSIITLDADYRVK